MNKREIGMVLAALRFWQASRLDSQLNAIRGPILESGGEELSDVEIEDLCWRLAIQPEPAVVIHVTGGSVTDIEANSPMRTVVCDHDQRDDDRAVEIGEDIVLLTDEEHEPLVSIQHRSLLREYQADHAPDNVAAILRLVSDGAPETEA